MQTDADNTNFSITPDESRRDPVLDMCTQENICGKSVSCVVYQCRLNGVRVAIKRLRPEYVNHPRYVAAYQKEFAIGQQLKHDALPTYRDLKVTFDEVYIVMDYVGGVRLDKFVCSPEGPKYFRQKENVHRFLKELLAVLAYMHHAGVVHSDLKPENIMLRHSDRAVMLIDLDKSYCDTLDLTHGGTPNMSAPLAAGKQPTVSKDLVAVGVILDWFNANVKGFPQKSIKKLRSRCNASGMTADTLLKLLNNDTKSYWWLWTTLFAGAVVVGSIIASRKLTVDPVISQPEAPVKTDTIVTVIQSETPQKPEIKIDFDASMASFIQEVNSANAELRSGELSDSEIADLIYKITDEYTATYGRCVASYKERHKQFPGGDVELMVAKASESSRASRLFQSFTQSASDTIAHRNPD